MPQRTSQLPIGPQQEDAQPPTPADPTTSMLNIGNYLLNELPNMLGAGGIGAASMIGPGPKRDKIYELMVRDEAARQGFDVPGRSVFHDALEYAHAKYERT